jgi:hypothetical protein
MPAVEMLIRNSLIENGHCSATDAEDMRLPKLIGAARALLRWDIPKHYTAKELYRNLRNAVSHGGEMFTHAPVRGVRRANAFNSLGIFGAP